MLHDAFFNDLLARDLAELAKKEGDKPSRVVIDMIKQCLGRDEGWKKYYEEKVRANSRLRASPVGAIDLLLAEKERAAFRAAMDNEPNRGAQLLEDSINGIDPDSKKAWYLQEVATLTYPGSPATAIKIQRAAYQRDSQLFCPPEFVRKASSTDDVAASAVMLDWFRAFIDANAALASIENLRSRLAFSNTPRTIERALAEVAALLGARGENPEQGSGEGPDLIWTWPDSVLIIEAKTGNDKSLHEKDAQQLVHSLRWYEETSAGRGRRIIGAIVARVVTADPKSGFPKGTLVLTEQKLVQILDKLHAFYFELGSSPERAIKAKRVGELMQEHGLNSEAVLKKYFVPVQEDT